ncbi:hypothetical protein GW915_08710 [bacterium]|nr:hypothetical protein [bacterium]
MKNQRLETNSNTDGKVVHNSEDLARTDQSVEPTGTIRPSAQKMLSNSAGMIKNHPGLAMSIAFCAGATLSAVAMSSLKVRKKKSKGKLKESSKKINHEK